MCSSDLAFAMEQAYLSRPRVDCFFESHQKYIDLQLIVAGEEIIEVADLSRMQVTAPFVEERDLVKYADTNRASPLRLRAGDAAVFFPEDAHMPCLQDRGAVAVLVQEAQQRLNGLGIVHRGRP